MGILEMARKLTGRLLPQIADPQEGATDKIFSASLTRREDEALDVFRMRVADFERAASDLVHRNADIFNGYTPRVQTLSRLTAPGEPEQRCVVILVPQERLIEGLYAFNRSGCRGELDALKAG